MKPPILLKLLRQISPKAATRKSNSEAGFSLIELVVVVLVIGILSAIAAPGWLAFTNRQRMRSVNDRVFRALRSAQSEAKLNKQNAKVTFTYEPSASPAVDPPKVSITGKADETLDANGEIKPGMVKLAAGECSDDACTAAPTTKTTITFNNLGAVDENDSSVPFVVTVSTPEDKLRRCVIVQTILGSMRTAEGDDCPVPGS